MMSTVPTVPIITSRELLQNMGRRAAQLRMAANISQPELAKMVLIRQQAISKLELCQYQPVDAFDIAFRIGHVFRKTPEWMVFAIEPPQDDEKRFLAAWRNAKPDIKMQVMMLLWPQHGDDASAM